MAPDRARAGASLTGRRILVLNARDLRHPQAGSVEVHCFEIFARLAAAGDRVTLLASGFPGGARTETIDGISVVRVGGAITYYAGVLRAYRRLRAAEPFDVVVEDLNKFPFFARLWVRKPLVVLIHHLFGAIAFARWRFRSRPRPGSPSGWCRASIGVCRSSRTRPARATSSSAAAFSYGRAAGW